MITIEEARELYKQGSFAKEVALRAFPEEEILNDYTLITKLPDIQIEDPTVKLFAQLTHMYREMSKGRPYGLTGNPCYIPRISITREHYRNILGEYVGNVSLNNKGPYKVYAAATTPTYEGRLSFENDGVYCGHGLLECPWAFREKGQAEHFVKCFWKELILLNLQDFHKVEFIDE